MSVFYFKDFFKTQVNSRDEEQVSGVEDYAPTATTGCDPFSRAINFEGQQGVQVCLL